MTVSNRMPSIGRIPATGLLSFLVLLPLVLLAAASGSRADPDAAAQARLVQPDDVRIAVDVSPASVVTGKPVKVTFSLTYPAGTRVYFPQSPAVKPFVLIRHAVEIPAVAGTGTTETHVLELLPVRVGTSVLQPLELPYVTASEETRITRTPEVRIQTGSGFGNETAPVLAGSGKTVPVYVPNTVLIWILAGLGIALVAAAGGGLGYMSWRRWHKAHEPPPPPRPPYEVAVEKLGRIDAAALIASGEYQQLALRVSEVVREYLGAVYGFAGVDLTSWEVMAQLAGRDLGRTSPVEVSDFLGDCDLVKFAKYVPSVQDAAALPRRAREIVDKVQASSVVARAVSPEGMP